jgi:hypothetical protein
MTAEKRLALIRVKLEHARKHFNNLEAEVQVFLDSKPYLVGVRTDPHARQTVFYLRSVGETPDTIPSIVGDILFNLRAALDHLACSLIEINHGKVTSKTSFPVINTLDHAEYKRASRGKVEGMAQAAIDAIDATEPYRGAKGHSLWQLHGLNILDKHRALITAGCELTTIRMHPTKRGKWHKALHDIAGIKITDAEAVAMIPVSEKRADLPCPLKGGDILHRDLFANEEVNPNNQFTFDIALNEPPIVECQPLLPTLLEMSNAVDDVIQNFKPFFA